MIKYSIRLAFLLSMCLTGCATPLRQSISSVAASELTQKGMIAGHMSLFNAKTKAELGGFFGPNFTAYLTKVNGAKKVYQPWVENKDGGYFGWLVEPGTYWVHYCRIKGLNEETTLSDMTPLIDVKAGEITYIGHIHYELGRTYFGKTMKKIFSSDATENLSGSGGVLVEAEQKVTDDLDDMMAYLQEIGLDRKPVRKQLVEGWKYVP